MKIFKKIAMIFAVSIGVIVLTSSSDNPVGDCLGGDEFLLSDTYCNIFYKCEHGVPVRMSCPSGLHFNAMLHVCDFPTNAGCDGPEDDGSGGGNGYICHCATKEQGEGCAANGASNYECAPSGESKCWKYNKNCI